MIVEIPCSTSSLLLYRNTICSQIVVHCIPEEPVLFVLFLLLLHVSVLVLCKGIYTICIEYISAYNFSDVIHHEGMRYHSYISFSFSVALLCAFLSFSFDTLLSSCNVSQAKKEWCSLVKLNLAFIRKNSANFELFEGPLLFISLRR